MTTSTPAAPAPTLALTDPAAAPTDPAAVIAGARSRIDDLDRRILDLVQQRMAVSAEVQAARIGSGGTRLALSRELEILARYRSALGPQGTEVAMQLLQLCRGRA
ncbi:chorismate mutase [Streptacidiphilus sp. PB12-B1b]|uniref:chorismate mutase n=1 Tax=Streptacidiphilus sp. PB12-B1b TaxID=2705012 RepID=UPI0015FCFAAD|nr:chorismate mutase [Streptacidiphilus sp. PB12-B1b]QMU79270.1 chorismate mutase [Streptacidiphilus sp. PB12-B1b]